MKSQISTFSTDDFYRTMFREIQRQLGKTSLVSSDNVKHSQVYNLIIYEVKLSYIQATIK